MINQIKEIFCEIPCLTEKTREFDGIALSKKWFKSADKRRISEYLLKFVNYNQKYFEFLGVTPSIIGFDQNSAITFRTTNFIGAIPLRAPDTGKQIGDFVVTPRFSGNNRYSDYINILNLLDEQLNSETKDGLLLASDRIFHPPFYYEACKFINLLEKLIHSNWNKFTRVEKYPNAPIGQVDWNSYANNEYKVENQLKFPTTINSMNENHVEYSYLKYVFTLCKKELLSINTPLNIKLSYKTKIQFIEQSLEFHNPVVTTEIPIHFSDSLLVKKCKNQANKILLANFIKGSAWRVDFSEVFEKYVQFIFTKVSKENGGKLFPNFKLSSRQQNNYSWSLKYLEPDAFYQKNDFLIMIDAKYKSHLYNKWDHSDFLKQEYRNDLHQILCYSSFNSAPSKYSFLCYPCSNVEINFIEYDNPNNQTTNTVAILGIPLNVDQLIDVQKLLINIISSIENNTLVDSEIIGYHRTFGVRGQKE